MPDGLSKGKSTMAGCGPRVVVEDEHLAKVEIRLKWRLAFCGGIAAMLLQGGGSEEGPRDWDLSSDFRSFTFTPTFPRTRSG